MRKLIDIPELVEKYTKPGDLVLNAGAGKAKITNNTINLDIVPFEDCDVVGDVNFIPFADNSFDGIVCCAVMQHCPEPSIVIKEFHRVLKSGGIVIADAPFVQPNCGPPNDYVRYSKEGIEYIFSQEFEIVACDVAISAGPAIAFSLRSAARSQFDNRYVRYAYMKLWEILAWPLTLLDFGRKPRDAGAFYLIGKKS